MILKGLKIINGKFDSDSAQKIKDAKMKSMGLRKPTEAELKEIKKAHSTVVKGA